MQVPFGVILILLVVCSAVTAFDSDFVIEPIPSSSKHSSGPEVSLVSMTVPSTGTHFTGAMALLSNVSLFHFFPPVKGACGKRVLTTTNARENGCVFATNGGFFDMSDGDCVGNLVADGEIIQIVGDARASFGITKNNEFVVGMLNETDSKRFEFRDLIGAGPWLVRDGKNLVAGGGLIAPRTCVGYSSNGTLIVLVADGVEDLKKGLTLGELGEIMVFLGAVQAVNLDGGGSSVAVYNGTIYSQPTCDDTGRICERTVTSITCIKEFK